MNGPGSARSAEQPTPPASKLVEYPPGDFLRDVADLYARWRARDWAQEPAAENYAASVCLYLLCVLDVLIRNQGTPLAKFIEAEADRLNETVQAVVNGDIMEPVAPPVPTAPQVASPAPTAPRAAPRPARAALRALGIQLEHDGSTLHEANPVELLSWSYAGDPASDPVAGMIRSIEDDLSILQSAITCDEQPLDESTLLMQISRLQYRAEAAGLLHHRVMASTDRSARAHTAAPTQSAAAPAPAAAAPLLRFQTEDMLERAADALDDFAALVDRYTSLDPEIAATATRRATYSAGLDVNAKLKQALTVAQLDVKSSSEPAEWKAFLCDAMDRIDDAMSFFDDAMDQVGKTRFRRRARRTKARGAILEARDCLRLAREKAAVASAARGLRGKAK